MGDGPTGIVSSGQVRVFALLILRDSLAGLVPDLEMGRVDQLCSTQSQRLRQKGKGKGKEGQNVKCKKSSWGNVVSCCVSCHFELQVLVLVFGCLGVWVFGCLGVWVFGVWCLVFGVWVFGFYIY